MHWKFNSSLINILQLINNLEIPSLKHIYHDENKLTNIMANEGPRLSNEDLDLTYFMITNIDMLHGCTSITSCDMDYFQVNILDTIIG